jgi:hypothetical protein
MPKQPPPKHNTGRFIFLATGVVVLVLAGVVTNWKWHWLGGGSTYETPTVDPDYLPADTVAVLHVNLRETQDSKYVNQEFRPVLRLVYDNLPTDEMQQSLGVDVARDVDWMRLAVPAGDGTNPLVILSGRFDPAKFKPAKDGPLRQVNKPGDHYRLYELQAPELRMTFTVAPAGNLLLLSGKPARVTEALGHPAGTAPALEDAALEELLKKIDRKQSIWGATALKKLQLVEQRGSPPVVKYLLSIFRNAEALYGGLTCGEDEVHGTVYIRADSEEEAADLERQLRVICETAKGDTAAAHIALSLLRPPPPLRPVLQLLGTGKVTREGDTVSLRCRLPEEKK